MITRPSQCRHDWRQCLARTAKDKFNECSLVAVGAETIPNLALVEQRLVTCFAPQEVLQQQAGCMHFHEGKPKAVTTQLHIGSVATPNNSLEKLPPDFGPLQKGTDSDLVDILASKAPKGDKELIADHGFDPQKTTAAEFAEICERAEATPEAPGMIQMTPQKMTVQPGSLLRRPRPRVLTRKNLNTPAKNTASTTAMTARRARFSLAERRKRRIGRRQTILKTNTQTASPSTRKSTPS